uniref:Uncharacterized protein n=1 Tax=Erwinia amylovora TaxID=552 RepID=A0A0N7L011_ERWAM|nr:hypothetical protein EAMY692_p10079 [Erwinia amylovora]
MLNQTLQNICLSHTLILTHKHQRFFELWLYKNLNFFKCFTLTRYIR